MRFCPTPGTCLKQTRQSQDSEAVAKLTLLASHRLNARVQFQRRQCKVSLERGAAINSHTGHHNGLHARGRAAHCEHRQLRESRVLQRRVHAASPANVSKGAARPRTMEGIVVAVDVRTLKPFPTTILHERSKQSPLAVADSFPKFRRCSRRPLNPPLPCCHSCLPARTCTASSSL